MSAGRHRLGCWRFPSGNSVDVFLEPNGAAPLRVISFEWDSPPPLRPRDARFYEHVVLPRVIRLLGEYLERPGAALVVQLGAPAR